MASLHVLERPNPDQLRVVAHIPLPDVSNRAGHKLRQMARQAGRGGGGTSVLPDGDGTGGTISPQEQRSLEQGELLEVEAVLRIAGVPDADLDAYLDAEYARLSAETLAALQADLREYGRTR